jgi:hypothetical protein
VSSAGRAVARGLTAGVLGTLAMDLLWYARHRREGGDQPFTSWEVTTSVESWDKAPAPAQMGRKLIEGLTGHDVPIERAAALSNVMHWAYGTTWATAYGLLVATRNRRRPWWHGPAFGAAVWASDYLTLPLAGVYEPIWRYDLGTLRKDLSAHLVFGTAADATLRVL